LYEANAGGGLYLRCANPEILDTHAINKYIVYFNAKREQFDKTMAQPSQYRQRDQMRLWTLDTQKFWINYSVLDEDGALKKDAKVEIQRSDLTQ